MHLYQTSSFPKVVMGTIRLSGTLALALWLERIIVPHTFPLHTSVRKLSIVDALVGVAGVPQLEI